MLALAAIFVYLRVSEELNDSIDEGLVSRTQVLIDELADASARRVELGSSEDPEDNYSQIIRSDGTLVDSTSPALSESVLDAGELAAVTDGEVGFDVGPLPGVDGDSRLLARPAEQEGERFVVVAGAATQDRDETLTGLITTFAIAAPLALLIASAVGYALATVAMRPVERMRRQAGEITLERSGERLPLPASRDEIHRLGETLNEMLDRIEDSLERERSFVADASHELRTPLAIARSELELGLRADRDLVDARAAMASASEEVQRLQRLTDDLLALARSDAARMPIEPVLTSIPDLLEGIRARYAPRAEADGRRVVISGAPPASAELDHVKVEGALANLVENALRHGGGEVELTCRAEGATLAFVVSDEGEGFPDGFEEVAFERFARAEGGRTTPGHGLGLAIVKAVAEAHGGSVSIDARASGGIVIMRIPKNPHQA